MCRKSSASWHGGSNHRCTHAILLEIRCFTYTSGEGLRFELFFLSFVWLTCHGSLEYFSRFSNNLLHLPTFAIPLVSAGSSLYFSRTREVIYRARARRCGESACSQNQWLAILFHLSFCLFASTLRDRGLGTASSPRLERSRAASYSCLFATFNSCCSFATSLFHYDRRNRCLTSRFLVRMHRT